MGLDVRTLVACLALVNVFLSAVMVLFWRTQNTYPGFDLWVTSVALGALAYLLMTGRGFIPDLLSIVAANVCVLSAAILGLEGTKRFFGTSARVSRVNLSLVPVGLVLLVLFTYAWDDVIVRLLLVSSATALIAWRIGIAWLVLRNRERGKPNAHVAIMLLFSLWGVVLLIRAVVWVADPGARSFLAPVAANTMFFFAAIGIHPGFVLSYVTMNGRRLARELEEVRGRSEIDRHRLADIFAFLPDATFAINGQGTVIAWNATMEALSGIPARQMLGKDRREYARPFYGTCVPISSILRWAVPTRPPRRIRRSTATVGR